MSLIFKTTFAFENILILFLLLLTSFTMIMMKNIRILYNLTASWDLGINNPL